MRTIPKEDPQEAGPHCKKICSLQKTEEVCIEENTKLFEIAPHRPVNAKGALTSDQPITKQAIDGDFFRFMKNVGGGGGHSLCINDFCVNITILYKSK